MLLDVQHDVEIARWTAKLPHFAPARKPDAGAVLYSSGNLCVDSSLPQHPAFSLTLWARIGDHAARSLARWASPCNAEESLLIAHLSTARTRAAGGRTFSCGGAGAAALFASLLAANPYRGLGAEKCFFELLSQIFAQVGSALNPAAAPPAATTKHLAESKEFAKDVAEILKHGRGEA